MKKQVRNAFTWMMICVVLFIGAMPNVSATEGSAVLEEVIETEEITQEQSKEAEREEHDIKESEQLESIDTNEGEEESESSEEVLDESEQSDENKKENEQSQDVEEDSVLEETVSEETIEQEEMETESSMLEEIQETEETEESEETEEVEETEETTQTQETEEMRLFVLSRDANTSGKITLDGSLSDWKNVSAQSSNDSYIKEWKAAMDEEGTLYVAFTGTAASEWDGSYQWKSLSITQNGQTESRQMAGGWSWTSLGASIVMINNAHGNSAADYVVEMSIPASYFIDENYSITFAETTVMADELPILDGNETYEEEKEPVYDGIVMDGDFSDWNAVKKVEISCPNSTHPQCIILVAAVFDGEYVYLYIKDGKDGNASGAGTHSNGKYAIVTDLGHELLFQLTSNGTVNGVEGALARHIGAQWEIAIPEKELPYYKQSISFGLYQSEAFIRDLVNLQGGEGNLPEGKEEVNDSEFSCDGSFAEWITYPHARITYATAGTAENVVDSEGALYATGSNLFGHAMTVMPKHLNEKGGCFTQGVMIRFNQESSMQFGLRVVSVDDAGRINWYPKVMGLDEGTYQFEIVSLDAWGTSTNISSVNVNDTIYGKMIMVIDGVSDEMEFYLDLEKIADKLGCDVSDFKVIDAQFPGLGYEWITTAGASSGALLGLFICLAVVWLYFLHAFRKAELHAWRFLWGSMGLFLMAMLFIQPYVTMPLSQCVTALAGIFGELTGTFEAYFKYGIIFINTKAGAMTLQIDFECSGIIEIMAFGSLLAFFRVYRMSEKCMVAIGGFAYIMICNAIRITIICLVVHLFGTQAYYVMHTFVGRFIFYMLSVAMYFYVFTKPHIIQMKVGNFTYGHRQANR